LTAILVDHQASAATAASLMGVDLCSVTERTDVLGRGVDAASSADGR
jgi:hypothetical protein